MSGIVVDRVTPEMQLFREESFGPQVSITRVTSDDEAVQLANDTEYGLAAAVFGRNLARALDVARRIESGICHVNGPTVHDEAQMPFGGVKGSGYGASAARPRSTSSRSCAGSPCRQVCDTIHSDERKNGRGFDPTSLSHVATLIDIFVDRSLLSKSTDTTIVTRFD